MKIASKNSKLLVSLTLIGCTLLTITAITMFFVMPSIYVSLDVNPSIEMHLNRLGNVVDIRPANADAEKLLVDYKPASNDSNAVMQELIQLMTQQGYLGTNKQNDILITVEQGADSAKTLEKLSSQVKECLVSQNLDANLIMLSEKIDPATEKAAEDNKVSAGKMSVIEKLINGDSTLKPEDLKDMRISDLMNYAKEKGIKPDVLEEHIDALEDKIGDSPELEALEEAVEDAADAAEEDDDDDDDDDKNSSTSGNNNGNTSTNNSNTNSGTTNNNTTNNGSANNSNTNKTDTSINSNKTDSTGSTVTGTDKPSSDSGNKDASTSSKQTNSKDDEDDDD